MESGSNNKLEEIGHALILTFIESIHDDVYPPAPTAVQHLQEYMPEYSLRGNIFIETFVNSVPPAPQ